MSKFLDRLLPLYVGHRTEITAAALSVLHLVALVLPAFGVTVPPGLVHGTTDVLAPAAVAFLGAKISRQ
jgi:hypothetical protein